MIVQKEQINIEGEKKKKKMEEKKKKDGKGEKQGKKEFQAHCSSISLSISIVHD